jgi:hypothetical protein
MRLRLRNPAEETRRRIRHVLKLLRDWENHPLVFRLVCETRNYKYFAGVCRGFLEFKKEKVSEWYGAAEWELASCSFGPS